VFAVAFGAGIMYLLMERELKRKKLGAIFKRLPSLNVLDDINYRCLTIGFPLLTLGIITGSIWASLAWGSYWTWDPKEVWSLITWLLYAALLHGRMTVGWRGRKAAILAIVGFCAVLFTFLGVNLLLPGLHTYSNLSG
jgi:cytochrome c-type biogenesis protein CcsB